MKGRSDFAIKRGRPDFASSDGFDGAVSSLKTSVCPPDLAPTDGFNIDIYISLIFSYFYLANLMSNIKVIYF